MIRFSILFVFCISSFVYSDLTPQTYENPPASPYSFLKFDEKAKFNRDNVELFSQNSSWRAQMKDQGEHLVAANVRSVFFVHGTFAGNDAVGIIDALKCVYPDLSPTLEQQLKKMAKEHNDKILKDTGNYLPEYIALFEEAIGGKIPCHAFNWSSGNHHLARLKGSLQLAKTLAKEIKQKSLTKNDRILLIGHSHAGQLFAILTNMLNNSLGTEILLKIAEESGEDVANIGEILAAIRDIRLDIVTFGTPPRYGWGDGDYRLLNIINHRGNNYEAGSPLGLLVTKGGDYIQQWGIAGTDIPASTKADKRLNEKLDSVLGAGKNLSVWFKNAKVRMRVPQYGTTILVDYQDNSTFLPNAIRAFFGHGVYTKYEKMLFNTSLIVDQLY